MTAETYELDAFIGRLRAVDGIGAAIAEEALPEVVKEAKATAAAGTDAYGTAWAPTKDGKPPLAHAAANISGVVSGSSKAVITLIVAGYQYRFHQEGAGKRLPKRAILPEEENGTPPRMAAAIAAAAQRVVARRLGGGT